MAERSWSLASICASSSSGTSSLTPIHNSSRLPMILSHGSMSSATANSVSTIRITIAAPEPQTIACLCCLGGSERAASAITTALSPDRMTLTPMILMSPTQNSAEITYSSIAWRLLRRARKTRF